MEPNIQWEQGENQMTSTFTLTCNQDGSVKLESGEFSETYPTEDDALKALASIIHQGVEASQQ